MIPQIGGLEITSTNQIERHRIKAEAKTLEKPEVCESCGNGQLHRHGTSEKTVHDAPLRGRAVEITVKQQRYRCQACEQTTPAPISGLHPHRRLTDRYFEELGEATLRLTFAEVASQYNVDETTLRTICLDYAQRQEEKSQFETPRTLGINTVHYKDQTHTLLVDIANATLYDLLKSPSTADLDQCIRALREPENVRTIVIDLKDEYYNLARSLLPHALLVVAPKTLRTIARQCVQQVKDELHQRATPTQRARLALADRFLDTPRAALTAAQKANHELLANPQARDQALQRITTAYNTAENLNDFYTASTRPLAETRARQWIQGLPDELKPAFSSLRDTLRDWWQPILDWREASVTEGQLEPVTALLNEFNARGRGYSFEVLRAKLLFYPPKRPSRSPRGRRGSENYMGFSMAPEDFTHLSLIERPARTDRRIKRGTLIKVLLKHTTAVFGAQRESMENK